MPLRAPIFSGSLAVCWRLMASAVVAVALLAATGASHGTRSGRSSGDPHKHYRSCGNMLIHRLQEVCEHRFADPKARLQRIARLGDASAADDNGSSPRVVVMMGAASGGEDTVPGGTRASRHHYHHHHRNGGTSGRLMVKPPLVADACCLQTCSDAFIRHHICDNGAATARDTKSADASSGGTAADESAADHLVIVKRSVSRDATRRRRK